METLEAVSDEKENATITHAVRHWHQTSSSVCELHLLRSLFAQLCYQSSLPTVVGLFCRCARLLLCHCCVFFTSGLWEIKDCPSVSLCAPIPNKACLKIQRGAKSHSSVYRKQFLFRELLSGALVRWEDHGVCLLAVV